MNSANVVHEGVEKELQSFGGYLMCTRCGKKSPLGDVGYKLKNGWPKCCGYTMRWVTAKEVLENE